MKEYRIRDTEYNLRYHDFPGEEEPVLFIHGLGCAGSFDYPEVASQESLKNHRCILVDLLGAGYSDKPEDFGYTIYDHANYLSEFVEDLGIDSFILYGHSMGGAIAITMADKLKNRVSQLILSESSLDKSGEDSISLHIAECGRDEYLDWGHEQLLEESRGDGNGIWAASLSNWLPIAAYLVSESLTNVKKPTWRDVLYSLDIPRTFIFGEMSLPDPDTRALDGHGIQIKIVEKAGHSMAWENPAGLAQAIKTAISERS